MEDNDLIKGTLHGDDRCFAALVDRYKNMVMAVVSRVVKNREDAEDLTQAVFVKAYLALGKFKGESRFSTWLFRIAYNEASSRYRQGKPDTVAVEDWMNFEQSVDTGCVGQLENLSARQRSQYVQQAMDRLDPRDAMLLTLFYLNEHSVAEISDICSMSLSNVKTCLSRARVRMGRILTGMLGPDAASILIGE